MNRFFTIRKRWISAFQWFLNGFFCINVKKDTIKSFQHLILQKKKMQMQEKVIFRVQQFGNFSFTKKIQNLDFLLKFSFSKKKILGYLLRSHLASQKTLRYHLPSFSNTLQLRTWLFSGETLKTDSFLFLFSARASHGLQR